MNPDILRDAALLVMLILMACMLLLRGRGHRARIAWRTRQSVLGAQVEHGAGLSPSADLSTRLAQRAAALGERIPVVQAADREKLAQRLARAGFRDRRAVAVVAGIKLIAGSGIGLMAILAGAHLPVLGKYFAFRILLMAGGFVIGMMLPEYGVSYLARQRRRAIGVAFPDALDLLVICTNAGNSLVVAVRRVAMELRTICPALADELAVTADELTIGGDIPSALHSMSERVGLPSMRSLVTTLIQSQKYGTPITQALRTLSKTERTTQMVVLEEKAAKLAPKMTLPMMLFVMPTVAIIAAGPAIILLVRVFRHHI